MTLALYGKSQRRQGGLVLAALLAVVLAIGAVFAVHQEAQATHTTSQGVSPVLASALGLDPNHAFQAPSTIPLELPGVCNGYENGYTLQNATGTNAKTTGTYALGSSGFTIDIVVDDINVVSFDSELLIMRAVIKGEAPGKGDSDANVYTYPPTYPTGVLTDDGLIAPEVSGAPAGIIHMIFCWNDTAPRDGQIAIKKIAASDPSQEFGFAVSPDQGSGPSTNPFSLVHNGEEPWSSQAGSYTITETDLPDGWALDSIVCTDASAGTLQDGGGKISLVTGGVTIHLAAGDDINCTFSNVPTGNLRIEKWNDLNGNGVRDGGEPAIANWPVTVSGPEFPGGQGFLTNESGVVTGLDGITTGFYTVTEGAQGGWYQTGLIVNTVSQPVSATTVVEVGESPAGQPRVETLVEFGNRELAEVIVTKTVTDLVGIPPRGVGGWHINLAGCGTSINKVTDGTGTAVFSNLAPADNCAYTVTETDTEGFTVSYSPGQVVTPGPGQTATVNVHNDRRPTITFETPTPTSTPVTPTEPPPTETPTEEPSPVQTVAGEKTPGPTEEPGVISTPIAPETGTGFRSGGTSGSIGLALLGLAAVTGSMMLLSLGRKRS